MADKILKENFDRLSKIEEAANLDPVQAKMLFKALDKYYDILEELYERLEKGPLGRRLEEFGFTGEKKGLENGVMLLLEEFSDILPGLEMTMNGDDFGESVEEASEEDFDAMQKRSQEHGDELDNLRSKLDAIRARVNSDEPGYDDRSTRPAPFTPYSKRVR